MSSCRASLLGLVCAAFLTAACSDSSSGGGPGPCETDPIPAACGAECDASTPCASGYFCGTDGTCTADCSQAGGQCADGEDCNASGQCVPGNGGDNAGDNNGDGDDCPAVVVNLTAVVPDVIFLLDQSGSMTQGFPNNGDPQRWEALKSALIGPNDGANNDGVLFDLQGRVNKMGATLYTSANGGPSCPLLTSTTPAVNGASDIKDLLVSHSPVEDTPTGESVEVVATSFPASDNPHVIVLATDGFPDTCLVPDPETPAAQTASEEAVQRAFDDRGVTTFVLSVGPDVSDTHLQRVANAGQGLDLDLAQPAAADFYRALNPADLVVAFEQISDVIRDCQIDIDGQVDLDKADQGTVVLNGTELTFGTDWEMVDGNTLRLLGAACNTFRDNADVSLTGEFPCGVVVD
jgi:hypothetical protein